jgi:transposase
MRDVELYRHLLGLEEPWTVRSVDLKIAEQRVDVWAGHVEGVRWPCPECGTELALYDHAEERVWRHLDSCQFLTYLHAPPPRVECPTHGVRQVRLPWAEARARFTSLCFARTSSDSLVTIRHPRCGREAARGRDDRHLLSFRHVLSSRTRDG